MDTFQAHLSAERLGKLLLTAHAYQGCCADWMWERHDLAEAVKIFDRLTGEMEAVRARLAKLNAPAEEAA